MPTFTSNHPPALERLLPGYGPLFDRAVEVLNGDERVRAVWVSGSLARGTADAASDLDLLVAVRDEDHEAFAAVWPEWLAAITPTLIARPLPFAPGSFYSVTPGRERLDVVVEPVRWLADTLFRNRLVVFDRDDLDAIVPTTELNPGPSAGTVAHLVEEFFRDYGTFDVVVVREDWLLGIEACNLVRGLLYQVFIEANAPLPMMGVKRWSDRLTDDQRAVLEGLPGVTADRESVMAAHEATAAAFVAAARPVCAMLGVPWPTELEQATRRHLTSLGLPALSRLPA